MKMRDEDRKFAVNSSPAAAGDDGDLCYRGEVVVVVVMVVVV